MATVTYIASEPLPGEIPTPEEALGFDPLPDFARILGNVHVTVDMTPRRMTVRQRAALARVSDWLYEETTRMVLEERARLRAAARQRIATVLATKRHQGRAAELRAAHAVLAELEASFVRAD